MWYKSPKEKTKEGLRMLHIDKDTMEIAKIGLRDNIVELFVVHKDGTTTRKACTIEEVQEIDGGEVGAPIVKIVESGPIVVHKAQSSEHAKVERSNSSGDDESEDDDYQPKSDDADSDKQWSKFSSKDSAMEVAFNDSDDN
ncbi:hypothetical protein AHAS_Ahas14G0107000 [Arachis hypogaea]